MASFKNQVSAAVRILLRNRDVSARATHLKAADGIVPFATLERKTMSTKTAFKRVALVAAAALAIGGVSSVPANAALATTVAVVTSSSSTIYTAVGTAATATISLATTTAETQAGSLVITPSISSQPTAGGLTVGAPASGTVGLTTPIVTGNFAATATANTWTNTVSAGVQTLAYSSGTIPAFAATAVSTFSLTPKVAGTYTVVLTPTGAVTTNTPVTITVIAAGLAFKTGDGAPVSPAVNGNGIAGIANTVTYNASTNASGNRALVTVSGSSAVLASGTAGTVATGNGSTLLGAGTADQAIVVSTPAAGSITVSEFYETGAGTGIYSSTADKTATITVSGAAVSGTPGTSSTNTMTGVGTGVVSSDSSSVTGSKATGVTIANIVPTLVASVGTVASTQAISASITGPGLLVWSATGATTATGRNFSSTYGTASPNLAIQGDGNSGTAVVTFTSGGYTFTKNVTFYGSLAKLTATVKKVLSADTGSSQPASLLVVGYDANGVVVPSQGLTVTSGSTSIIASYTTPSAATATSTAAQGGSTITGKFGTVVLSIADTATGLVTTTATVTASSATASKVTIAFDAASYAPGAPVVMTVSATDANSLPLPDGTALNTVFTATPLASASLQGFPTDFSAISFAGGSKAISLYAPLTGGTVTVSGTDSATAAAVTASFSVAADTTALDAANAAADAAAEATDAANAATDAANAAADAADSATSAAQDAADQAGQALAAVNSLATSVAALIAGIKAQLTSLTNLVVKLQKSVSVLPKK